MQHDNTTPMNANEYDKQINSTIPYYGEFYEQTLDIVEQCGFDELRWLDLGCGTGTLETLAFSRFSDICFVLADPSEKMLEQAQQKLADKEVSYLCASSDGIDFADRFNVVTAIQSHHYMSEEKRRLAVDNVYRALTKGGVFICFENVIPEDEELKRFELLRWGRYQQRHGKTAEEALAHNARCGVNYFPITVEQHIRLLQNAGFVKVYVFWRSYMQMGILAFK